jgi:citrate lyase synthetase
VSGKVLVAADGRISGVLDAEEIESCTFGFDRTRSGLTLVLDGTASASELTVHHTGSETVSTTTGYFPFAFIKPDGTLDPVPIPITAPGRA